MRENSYSHDTGKGWALWVEIENRNLMLMGVGKKVSTPSLSEDCDSSSFEGGR